MQPAANVTSGDGVDWHAIDWKRVYRTVKNLRQRIFRASRQGDLTRVRSLQRLMLKSKANALESVGRCATSSAPSISTRFIQSVGSISPSGTGNVRLAFLPSLIDVSKPW